MIHHLASLSIPMIAHIEHFVLYAYCHGYNSQNSSGAAERDHELRALAALAKDLDSQ